ncbi:hypothetical protein [Thiomonas sp.]|uniref:Uncharacterized protein n=1 Tax=mine drainage metagenome TaxID=410659 RepID=A0A3P3ZSB7_9ZZZZ
MNAKTFEAFQAQAYACGFDEALVRRWPPDTALDTHTTRSMRTRW